jgi:hypothetical protein
MLAKRCHPSAALGPLIVVVVDGCGSGTPPRAVAQPPFMSQYKGGLLGWRHQLSNLANYMARASPRVASRSQPRDAYRYRGLSVIAQRIAALLSRPRRRPRVGTSMRRCRCTNNERRPVPRRRRIENAMRVSGTVKRPGRSYRTRGTGGVHLAGVLSCRQLPSGNGQPPSPIERSSCRCSQCTRGAAESIPR